MSVRGGGLKHANALARQLAAITPKPRLSVTSINPRVPLPRVDVVSESLCDDVISYLSPTLEQHKGCTLIDLQPGACLFSTKLHDFLKPKRHLLIEPEDHYYEPFIKPLLDRPGSNYRYTQLNIVHQYSYWDEFSRIQRDPDLLPPQRQLEPDDASRRQLDSSTLIIGNLARDPRKKYKANTVGLAPVFLYNMAYHALANRHMHNEGLVRMLFWLPERYKPYVFSILPWFRSGLQASLDLSVHTSEVTSVQPLTTIFQGRVTGYVRRVNPALFEHISNQEVAAKTRKLGMVAPPGRKLESLLASLSSKAEDIAPLSPFRIDVKTSEDLQEIISTIRARIVATAPTIRSRRRMNKPMVATLEYPQVRFIVDEYSEAHTLKLEWWRSKILLDLALRILHVEANLKALEENETIERTSIQKLHDDAIALDNEFKSLCDCASTRVMAPVNALLDDQIAFFLSPRLVNYPERSYEAIKADSSDFFPQQDLALFDFIPKPKELSVPGLATPEECARFCSQLVTVLFSARGQSLPSALDKIGVNAAQDLIPMVPAITDARKGGRLDPNSVKVRMVTEEMIEGLVKAFFEWPFRPKSWEVAMSTASSAAPDDPAVAEEPEPESEESAETER